MHEKSKLFKKIKYRQTIKLHHTKDTYVKFIDIHTTVLKILYVTKYKTYLYDNIESAAFKIPLFQKNKINGCYTIRQVITKI